MNYQLIEASNVKEGNGLSGFPDRGPSIDGSGLRAGSSEMAQ